MTDRLVLQGRKTSLQLFGVTETEDGITAQGYLADTYLRKGRVFKHDGGKYELVQGLPAGVFVRCDEDIDIALNEDVVLLKK